MFSGANVNGVAHIDVNENTADALSNLANLVVNVAGDQYDEYRGLDLHLIGGYLDPYGIGDAIFSNIMGR